MTTHATSAKGLLLSLVVASIAALVVVPSIIDRIELERTRQQVSLATIALTHGEDGDILQRFSDATRAVARRVRPSVVHVMSAAGDRGRHEMIGNGSGWVWDATGHVVTNWHVVEDADHIEVQLHDGELRNATLIGSDPSTDVALLKVGGASLVPATRTPDFKTIEQGDLVFAFGSPLDFRFSMSSGLVSGLGRTAGIVGDGRRGGYEDFIQVDAAINPGNSGGPLTDAKGRVIGMNTAIATHLERPDGTGIFSGIGLAIPLPMIESVVTQLLDHGTVRKGYLGIAVVEPTYPMGQMGGDRAPAGVLALTDAIKGVNAMEVILRCNDERVYTGQELLDAWKDASSTHVNLEVLDLDTLLTRRVGSTMPPRWPDDKLIDATMPMHDFVAMHDGPAGGVIVTLCLQDAPASESGLQPGDLILRINDRPINTVGQLRSAVSSIPPGTEISIDAWRWNRPKATHRHRATLATHPSFSR